MSYLPFAFNVPTVYTEIEIIHINLETTMAVNTLAPNIHLKFADEETDIDLDALQGLWSVEQYIRLSNQTNRLIEYTDGVLEALPMPTKYHQAISKTLFLALLAVVQRIRGDVFYAPLRLQVRSGKFREPDLLLVLDKEDPRAQDEWWLGADLVVEIVSPDNPKRDTEDKPPEYAAVGVLEYWIVKPLNATITVLVLQGDGYATHGMFRRGQRATSVLLPTFSISVDDVFNSR